MKPPGLRVIAGSLRGRKLGAPRGLATRPTASRAREGLFGVLGDVSGLRVADLYAGSGALGIEALSRGAARAVFLESAREARTVLEASLAQLGVEASSRVVPLPVERAAAMLRQEAPLDLVLADPPWPIAERVPEVLARVLDACLAPGARIVIGHRAGTALRLPEACPWVLADERRWGDSAMTFFVFDAASRGT